MSMSKKARMCNPADDEEQALVRKHGRPMCDSMAGSLKKEGGSGYKHVALHRRKGTYAAQVYDIEAGKLIYLGAFYTPYAAAVTAALSKTKGLQDKRDAALLSGSLTAEQAEQLALDEGLTLGRNSNSESGFTNVSIQDDGKSTLRPFRIRPVMYKTMPSSLSREYISAEHAALVIARHEAK